MKDPREIIIRPIISEKAVWLANNFSQYVFEVHPDAPKPEIKKAVEQLFKVHVEKVRVINVKPKPRRRGRAVGRTKRWKKAIVTLRKGEKIPLIEGV